MSKTDRKITHTTSLQINLDKIPKDKIYKGEKGSYAKIVVWTFDKDDEYGKNATAIVSQTEEEREKDAKTIQLGNGWCNEKKGDTPKEEEKDEIPF